MDGLGFHTQVSVVTEDDVTKQNDFFLGIIDAGSITVLVISLSIKSNMPKEIASHCILSLVWSRQLNDLRQIMQHNPCIEQALIELRIDLANGIGQAHHGRCMIGQARFRGMVVGLSSWIRVEFFVVLGVEISGQFFARQDFQF